MVFRLHRRQLIPLGMKIHELETPALIIDLDRMEGNLQRMADYCHEHGLDLRPHTKTHKIPSAPSGLK